MEVSFLASALLQATIEENEEGKVWNPSVASLDLDFIGLNKVGRGGFSTVYKAYSLSMQKECALKYLKFNVALSIKDKFLEHEIQKKAVHENILQHWGTFLADNNKTRVFVMDFYARSLHDVIYGPDCEYLHEEIKIKTFIRQIVSGTVYIQNQLGYIHKDLKPRNIMLVNDNCVKITDFGCAVVMKSTRFLHKNGSKHSPRGTLPYLPSEDLVFDEFDSTADVWAIGCIAFEFFIKAHPFRRENADKRKEIRERVRKFETGIDRSPYIEILQARHPEACEFIIKVLVCRSERPVISEMANLVWLKDEKEESAEPKSDSELGKKNSELANPDSGLPNSGSIESKSKSGEGLKED